MTHGNRPMRIAIDAHCVGSELAGNVTFITSLIENLAKIDQTNEYTLYMSGESVINEYSGRWPNFSVQEFPARPRFLRFFVMYPRLLRQQQFDLFFCQFNAPPAVGCKIVTAIHDVSYLRIPDTFPLRMKAQIRVFTKLTAIRSAHIIAPSNHARDDIANVYGLADDKLSTVSLAAPEWYRPVTNLSELARVRSKYGLDKEYILCVGTIQPRKNIVRLIEAYSSLLRKGIDLPRLAIVGKKGWLPNDSLAAAAINGIEDHVVFTGFVPDSDMPALYSGALFFVYPSYFEGFGLPPLEAMQCGTPVITGDRTSLPEVVGDAGLSVDPFNVNAIAQAIELLATNAELRDNLRNKGLEQAAKFSWRRAARETLDIFERVHYRSTKTDG